MVTAKRYKGKFIYSKPWRLVKMFTSRLQFSSSGGRPRNVDF